MAYATQQDLVDRFGAEELIQLTDRVAIPPATIDAAVLQRALDDATAMIDGYLLGRYALPLPTTPSALVKVSADVARYFLWGDRADPKGAIAAAYGDARAFLDRIAKGVVSLDAGGAPPPPATTGGARIQSSEAVFTRRALQGGP